MSAKATGIPRKNRANRKTSPSTPTATLPIPGSLCVATHHAPSMGRHPRPEGEDGLPVPGAAAGFRSAFQQIVEQGDGEQGEAERREPDEWGKRNPQHQRDG